MPRRESVKERVRPPWLHTRLVLAMLLGATLGWWLLIVTQPMWVAVLRPVGLAAVKLVEPWPLTVSATLQEDGELLQFRHIHASSVPMLPQVKVRSLLYGSALWCGLALAVPFLSWRRRLRDWALGLVFMGLVMVVAVVARVEYQYATISQAPFPELLDNWRGWLAYFVNVFFMEIGFFVLPVAVSAFLHRHEWATVVLRRWAPVE